MTLNDILAGRMVTTSDEFDNPSACQHDKCYSPYVLTSMPPQYPWVCRKCGTRGTDRGRQGTDRGRQGHDPGEYGRLTAGR